jgi:hypothetical protein
MPPTEARAVLGMYTMIAGTKAFVKNIGDCPELGVVGLLLSWRPIHYLAETSEDSVT